RGSLVNGPTSRGRPLWLVAYRSTIIEHKSEKPPRRPRWRKTLGQSRRPARHRRGRPGERPPRRGGFRATGGYTRHPMGGRRMQGMLGGGVLTAAVAAGGAVAPS